MATRMTINGVSTCTTGEKYEKFQMKIGRKVRTMLPVRLSGHLVGRTVLLREAHFGGVQAVA